MTKPKPDRDLSEFVIERQPDDTTCGPTCLHAVYKFFGLEVPLSELLAQVETVEGGGTLGVLLATHALSRGCDVTIVTWNLQVFDPTWFATEHPELREKLLLRAKAKEGSKLAFACRAYVNFLDAGGKLEFRDLEPSLLRNHLRKGKPILTGLSANFLYRDPRENPETGQADDIGGDPVGHFVVLTGYEPEEREVLVSDPMYPNPLAKVHTYPVQMQRLIGAIYLGVLTYDANLILIDPTTLHSSKGKKSGNAHHRRS